MALFHFFMTNTLSCIYTIYSLSTNLFMDTCFHVLAIVNSAAMNNGAHVSFRIMIFSRYMPRSGIAGYMVTLFSKLINFKKNIHTLHGMQDPSSPKKSQTCARCSGLPGKSQQLYFQFLRELPFCFSQWLYQFTFLLIVQEGSLFSTPSPAFIVDVLMMAILTHVR